MLYRRGDSWWYKFKFAGRLFREPAKTKSKTLARDIERNRRHDIEAGYHRLPKRMVPHAIEVEAREWLVLKRGTLAPSSFEILRSSLDLHLLPKLGDRLLVDIDAHTIARYQRQRGGEHASPKTINLEVATLRGLLRHHGLWTEALARDVRFLRTRDDKGKALTVEQERRLIDACGQSRSRSLLTAVLLALQTGLRYSELRLLRWSQVDYLTRELTVGKSKTDAGTGRVVPLNERAFAALQQWATQFPDRERHHYVFPAERVGQGGGYAIDPERPIGSWKTAWTRARRAADVHVRFHDIRHTVCTRMLEGGVPLSVVATILGWSAATTAMMSKRYGHIGDAARRSAVAVLDRIGVEFSGRGHKKGHNFPTAEAVNPASH